MPIQRDITSGLNRTRGLQGNLDNAFNRRTGQQGLLSSAINGTGGLPGVSDPNDQPQQQNNAGLGQSFAQGLQAGINNQPQRQSSGLEQPSLGSYDYNNSSNALSSSPFADEYRLLAKGGQVEEGEEVMVGGAGPEKFIPETNGEIVPNQETLGTDQGDPNSPFAEFSRGELEEMLMFYMDQEGGV